MSSQFPPVKTADERRNWNSTKINSLLAQLVANGASGGNLEALGTDAAPTGAGITDKNTLIARGWTMATH